MTTWPRLGRVLGAAVIVLLLLEPTYRIDLDVYRIGAQVWMHGGALYGQLPATSVGIALPFTYPPMAAVLLAPLALVPMWLAALVLTVTSMLLVRLLLQVFAASVSARAGDTELAKMMVQMFVHAFTPLIGSKLAKKRMWVLAYSVRTGLMKCFDQFGEILFFRIKNPLILYFEIRRGRQVLFPGRFVV